MNKKRVIHEQETSYPWTRNELSMNKEKTVAERPSWCS